MTSHRVAKRFIIGLVILGALVYGFQFFQSLGGHISDAVPANTDGLVAAIRYGKDGQSAVVIKPDGTVVVNTGHKDGVTDRDATWNPSGNRLYFVSDRKSNAFHIYNWNPITNVEPEQRTVDNSGRSNPSFEAQTASKTDSKLLITSRGIVQEFHPIDGSTPQVLPSKDKEAYQGKGEESTDLGTLGQSKYKALGTSFRIAKWLKDRTYVASVMRREQGEILVIQSLNPNSEGKIPDPMPIIAAEKIEIAVDPATGNLVYSATEFLYPDQSQIPPSMIKGGKVTKPFEHCVGILDPEDPKNEEKNGLVLVSPSNDVAFANPAVSPDGSALLVVTGKYDGNGSITSKALLTMPVRPRGGGSASAIIRGEVYEPSWHPKGSKIVFIQKEAGKRGIFTSNSDGTSKVALSKDSSSYGYPQFSPQSK